MPINPNRSASDYTTYLKAKAVAATNTRQPRLNDVPVPATAINTAIQTSAMGKIVDPARSVLVAPIVKNAPPNRVNHPFAKSTLLR